MKRKYVLYPGQLVYSPLRHYYVSIQSCAEMNFETVIPILAVLWLGKNTAVMYEPSWNFDMPLSLKSHRSWFFSGGEFLSPMSFTCPAFLTHSVFSSLQSYIDIYKDVLKFAHVKFFSQTSHSNWRNTLDTGKPLCIWVWATCIFAPC